ncbi:hypothetical protein PI124_g3541 [Phytophthora idaei]|nr:hypothetical protein PI124_g3541 [Phytophthora idaei]
MRLLQLWARYEDPSPRLGIFCFLAQLGMELAASPEISTTIHQLFLGAPNWLILHDLVDDETSGHYEFLPQLLSSPLPEAEAGILGKATKGLGTKEDLNYPVVVDHTNAEILTKTYYEMYGHGLGSVLDSDLHTDYKKAILA